MIDQLDDILSKIKKRCTEKYINYIQQIIMFHLS